MCIKCDTAGFIGLNIIPCVWICLEWIWSKGWTILRAFFKFKLTLIGQKHLGERRQPDEEVQDGAAVGVVRAVVIGLDGGHGVVLSLAFLILLLQILWRKSMLLTLTFYIYIYAFSRRFYPKRLTVHSGYTFFFYQYVCSLGIDPMTFCAANAMLYHWATGTLTHT